MFPPLDKGNDKDEGISYNGDDNNAATNDSNDAGIRYGDSKEEVSTSSVDDVNGVGAQHPPSHERIIVEDGSSDEDDGDDKHNEDGADDGDVEPPPMGRCHRERRHNVRLPHKQFLF